MQLGRNIRRIADYLGDRIKLNESYKVVFNNVHGEIVLRHLIKTGYVFVPTYVPGDPNETAHREGMRRLVLSICRQIRLDEEKMLELMEQEDGRSNLT